MQKLLPYTLFSESTCMYMVYFLLLQMQWVLIALAVACVVLLLGLIGALFLVWDTKKQAKKTQYKETNNQYNNTIDYKDY